MNKFIKITALSFILSIFTAYGCWAKYYAADFMDIKTAEKKWGTVPLDKKLFKNGDIKNKAPMAVDIVKNKTYVGKDMLLVRKELEPDGRRFKGRGMHSLYSSRMRPLRPPQPISLYLC